MFQSRTPIAVPTQIKIFRYYGITENSLKCFLHFITDISLGLRDVRVTIPAAVRKGDTVKLICNYDMENDTLYSIKWYKGKREFYRFTPNESLVMKTFPVMGIQVQVNDGIHTVLQCFSRAVDKIMRARKLRLVQH